MKTKTTSKLLAVVLSLCMILPLMPVQVFAADSTTVPTYAVMIGENGYESLDAALVAAKASGLTDVEITVTGDITLSTAIKDFTKVTFTGTDRAQTIDMNLGAAINVNTELVFNNLTVSRLDSDWLNHYTYIHGGLTYNNCKMIGLFNVTAQDTNFSGCDFYNDDTFGNGNYSIWLYNCAEGVEVNITDCTFDVYERAIKIYGDGYNGVMTLNISGTEFTSRTADKTVVEMAYDNSTGVGSMNLNITDSTATGFGAPEHITGEANAWFNVEGSDTVSTVKVDGTVVYTDVKPTGTVTPAYTDSDSFWGEAIANATTSLVIELYEGVTKIGTSTLDTKYIGNQADGRTFVTWNLKFSGTGDDWTYEWAEGYPKYDMNPDTVKLVVDGVTVASNVVKWSAADDLNKIVALAETSNGIAAYTSLSDALNNVKTNGNIMVLRDVNEDLDGQTFFQCTIATNVEGGVTITNTGVEDYIYCEDLTIGSGVTVKSSGVFFQGGDNYVEGDVIVTGAPNDDNVFYQSGNAKTTVWNGGSITVDGSTILRYNTNADAGLYIYGDGDDSTVEFSNSYYIGAYSGTFYAEDANIETGYFLLKPSYDTEKEDATTQYPPMNVILDNSSLKVVGTTDGQDSFIIDDQASLTLANDSSIKDVRDFSILTGTNLELSVDNTSSISATNMSIAEDVPFEATQNADGTYGVAKAKVYVATVVAADGTETKYEDLHEAMTACESGQTVKLISNVDLTGIEWEPVSFKGTFDGQDYTISNLTINKPGVSNTGFITSLNGTFKNVTFTNPTVTGGECTGVLAGRAGGNAALAENITVNGTIKVETTHSGYARAGVIVGGWAYGNYKNITVDGGDKDVSYIKHTGGGDGRYVAGIVGHADDVESYVNCTVKNITISGGWLCGGIAGPGPSDGSATGCTVSNINMNADYSGGMFGWGYGFGTISDSTIEDVTFTAGSTNNGAINGYGVNDSQTVSNVTISNVKNADGAPLLDHVAQIGDTYYTSLADALKAAVDGDTVTLLDNVTLTEGIRVDDSSVLSDITLDGNNKTITLDMNGEGTGLRFGDSNVSAWATGVKIHDLTITGSAKYALWLNGGTSSELTNVTVTGEYDAFYGAVIFYGTHGATLDNCQIDSGFTNGQAAYPLNLTNDTVITKLVANDGADMNPKIFIDSTSSITTLYADTHTAMLDVNSMDRVGTILDSNTEKPMVAEVNSVQFSNLQSAIDAAATGDTVILRNNITLTTTVAVIGTSVLELNDYTITGSFDLATANSTLTAPEGLTVTTTVANSEVEYEKDTYTVVRSTGIVGESLVLENELCMKFFIYLPDPDLTNDTIQITVSMDDEGLTEQTFDNEDLVASDDSMYYIAYTGITPQRMTDTINVTLTHNDDVYTKTVTVKEYCEKLLANDAYTGSGEVGKKLETLINDLLNYGSAAQKYLNPDIDKNDLANPDYAGTETQTVTNEISTTGDVTDATATWSGASLLLKSNVAARFFFTATDLPEGAYVMVNETEIKDIKKSSDYYYVTFHNFYAHQMRDVLKVTVYNANGTAISQTLNYSIDCYLTQAIKDTSLANYNELVDLLNAMIKYGDSTYNYGVATGHIKGEYRS